MKNNNEKTVVRDKKMEYLIKTFSRTKRKNYENYIINAIWEQLGNFDIRPVTQQYVKCGNGNYYLIDLYFPQLNYGVEIDEAYHNNESQKERDERRSNRIYQSILNGGELSSEKKISAIENAETEGYIERRVEIKDKTFEEINNQIVKIVEELKVIINQKDIKKWDIYKESFEIARQNKSICVNDCLYFRVVKDIMKCFNRDIGGWQVQRGAIPIMEDRSINVWWPQLAVKDKNGDLVSPNGKWKNILSSDWNSIEEIKESDDKMYKCNEKEKRIVFAKAENCFGEKVYIFVGVFGEAKRNKNSTIYQRIDDKIDLTPWLS